MRRLILFLSLILSIGFASAQSEVPSDSICRASSSDIRRLNDFLLNMRLMNVAPPKLPKFSLNILDASKDYNQIFRLSTDASCTQGFTDTFSSPFSGFGYGYGWELSFSPQFMQMGTFRLKNGWGANTYGDYDKDGWGVSSHSTMPWEENNLRKAFELKSSSGNFGIRIEVQQERSSLY